jgi:catechol 2,3-dioxygenase-like lactoylglutathione lyase family enzyme
MNLNQVTVPSRDVTASIEFYQALGLELIVHGGSHYARFLCPDGQSTFSVHEVESLPEGDGVAIYFECDKLDEQVESLQQKGIIIDQGPEDQAWLWREARLKDPDGNRLILYHAGENRVNPPWRLKTS